MIFNGISMNTKVFKENFYLYLIETKVNIESDTYNKEIAVTLLSNGTSNLFKENSLTFFQISYTLR